MATTHDLFGVVVDQNRPGDTVKLHDRANLKRRHEKSVQARIRIYTVVLADALA
jgi:hypothetical protein